MADFNHEQFMVVHDRIHKAVGEAMADPRLTGMNPAVFFDAVLSTVTVGMVSVGISPEPHLLAQFAARPTERGAEAIGCKLLAGRASPPAGE